MSAWGTAISSNDTFADVYGEFFDLYNDGLSVEAISKKLIAGNQEIINDPDDSNNFWFALAKAQWECKQLDNKLLDSVQKIIESGIDLEIWRQLEASEKDIKKRKLVLNKFLADLQTERPKAKARKKKIIRQPVFEKGDCFTFKLENGNYGGAVVLEAIKNTEYGHNLIAVTRINQSTKPTTQDFEKVEVLVLNFANWNDEPQIGWYLPVRHKNVAHLFETVCNIEVQLSYDINNSNYPHVSSLDIWIIEVVNLQFESEKTKPRSRKKLTIKQLTRKRSWTLW